MNKNQIENKLAKLIRLRAGMPFDAVIPPSHSFTGDLEFDSLDVIELFITVEHEFNIHIPDEDAEKIATFGELTKYLETKVQTRNTANAFHATGRRRAITTSRVAPRGRNGR
ncbi:MAG: acyl carrier protein [Rickettsiales bacterium]|jgi:acyl carrier protein|nr:acyl carrier protein [Rickettsiales bacterium]